MAIRLRYPEIAPEGYAALSSLGHYVNTSTALSPVLLGIVNLRSSLLNGCSFCINMHSAELRKLGEPQTRIDAVAQWAGSDALTPREQAALAWTDTLTLLQTGTHASEEDYATVRNFFEEKDVVDLTFAIAAINAWNRMGVAFRPSWSPQKAVAGDAHAPTQAAQVRSTEEERSSVGSDDGGKVAQDV